MNKLVKGRSNFFFCAFMFFLSMSCQRLIVSDGYSRSNKYIRDEEEGRFTFWNDSLQLFFQPEYYGKIAVAKLQHSRAANRMLKVPTPAKGKLISTFTIQQYDLQTQQAFENLIGVIEYAADSRVVKRIKGEAISNKYGVKFLKIADNDLLFQLDASKYCRLFINSREGVALDSMALHGILNGFCNTKKECISSAEDNWYGWAEMKAVDSTDNYASYLREMFFMADNYHWASSFNTGAGQVFGTAFCDIAAQLHKLNLIRNYLKKYNDFLYEGNSLDSIATLVSETVSKGNTRQGAYISSIMNKIGNARVVMINENHFDWRHRYFTETLLDSFKSGGFDMIGFETLGYDDSINIRKYPNFYSGYYNRESQMSNLIRSSAQKGFSVYSYEDNIFANTTVHADSFNCTSREWEQAKNIAGILDKNPGRKLLIHAGHGHINENKVRTGGIVGMAEVLRRKFGYDPFTINQTFLDDLSSGLKPDPGNNPGFYEINKSDLLAIDSSSFSQCDLFIFNNIYYYPCEQTFLPDGGIQLVRLNKPFLDSLLTASGLQSTLEIIPDKEFATAFPVPYYIKHILPIGKVQLPFFRDDDTTIPAQLYLPEGRYVLILRSHTGNIYFRQSMGAGLAITSTAIL